MLRVLAETDIARLLANASIYRSKAIVRATRVQQDTTWTASGGNTLSANTGDWWVVDGNDKWSVTDDVFVRTYERLAAGRYRKSATVSAARIDAPFAVQTLEGLACGRPGDWLVQNPTGECWPVPHAIFSRRYERASPDN